MASRRRPALTITVALAAGVAVGVGCGGSSATSSASSTTHSTAGLQPITLTTDRDYPKASQLQPYLQRALARRLPSSFACVVEPPDRGGKEGLPLRAIMTDRLDVPAAEQIIAALGGSAYAHAVVDPQANLARDRRRLIKSLRAQAARYQLHDGGNAASLVTESSDVATTQCPRASIFDGKGAYHAWVARTRVRYGALVEVRSPVDRTPLPSASGS